MRNGFRRFAALIATICMSVVPFGAVSAQTWICVSPVGCSADVTATAEVHPFALRLENPTRVPVPSHAVQFSPSTAPVVIVTGSASGPATNGDGIVFGYVRGRITAPLTVLIQANFNGTWREQQITFRPASSHQLKVTDPDTIYWYAASQVRGGANVHVDKVTAEECRRLIVRFEPVTPSSVSADSVTGSPDGETCRFRTDWRLADQAGRQQLQATLGSSPPVHLYAISRRKSSIRVSLAAAYIQRSARLSSTTTRSYKVVRQDTLLNLTVEYDSMDASSSVTDAAWELQAMPLILFDTPIHPKFVGLRLAVGADPRNFTRDFFIGFSLLQPRFGIDIEDVGIDLQAGLVLSRDRRLSTPATCAGAIAAASTLNDECDTTESFRVAGGAITASVDAQSLISAFGKLIGITP